MHKVSVVIPCRNEKNYIGQCLDSFINQTYSREHYEVLVCDGMSSDGTREIVNEYQSKHGNIKLIDNPELTAPKAMNKGILASDSDIIIIFGAHAFADERFVENNVKMLDKEGVGCVGGPIKTISEDTKGEAIALAMSSSFGVGNALFRYAEKEMFVDTVAFGAYKRKVLDEIGYFDGELVRNQDDELNLRVTKKGYRILLSPIIRSSYYSRNSLKRLWKQYYQYGFWKVRVMQKHGKVASMRHLVPVLFVICNILGILLGLISKVILALWIVELLAYFTCDLYSSLKLSKKDIRVLKYLPIIFPILHLSYGIGFAEGMINFYILKSTKSLDKNTKMSR